MSPETLVLALAALERDKRELLDMLGTPDGCTPVRRLRFEKLSTASAELICEIAAVPKEATAKETAEAEASKR